MLIFSVWPGSASRVSQQTNAIVSSDCIRLLFKVQGCGKVRLICHNCTVLSAEAAANCLPSGDQATFVILPGNAASILPSAFHRRKPLPLEPEASNWPLGDQARVLIRPKEPWVTSRLPSVLQRFPPSPPANIRPLGDHASASAFPCLFCT